VKRFSRALSGQVNEETVESAVDQSVRKALERMWPDYEDTPSVTAPVQQSVAKKGSIEQLFRDIDD
jgi:hypothetical protein